MKKKMIIALGGSLIVPDGIDVNFLEKFKKAVLGHLRSHVFIIVAGGGKFARKYQVAGVKLGLKKEELDWLGIGVSQANAWLLNYVFGGKSPEKILLKPKKVDFRRPVQVAGGYHPGWSTDYVAVQFAVKNRIDTILNISNIAYVCDKDPEKYRGAKRLKELTWTEYEKIVGGKWSPGMSAPFDPVATKAAKKRKLKVVSLGGKNIANISNFLAGKEFKGTVIDTK